MTIKTEIVRQIETYGVPSRMVCPQCLGGSTIENCMTVYEGESGAILATCHRDACSFGTTSLSYRYSPDMAPDRPSARPKGMQWREIWDRSRSVRTHPEPTLPYEYEYGASVRGLFMRYDDSLDSLVFAVKTHAPATTGLRKQYGVVTKRLGGVGTKSLFLADPGHTGLAWYPSRNRPSPVVCVEDCLSAIALHEQGLTAVSLNGTHMNEDRFSEIRAVSPDIVIMLDADATATASATVTRYLGRANILVQRLQDDIKDMSRDRVMDFLLSTRWYDRDPQ